MTDRMIINNSPSPSVDSPNIVSQLFSRVDELSNAICHCDLLMIKSQSCKRTAILLEAVMIKKVPQIKSVKCTKLSTSNHKFIT